MNRPGRALLAALVAALVAGSLLAPAVSATGVGDATWTPARSVTSASESRFLLPGDSITIRVDETWGRAQSEGLAGYLASGLRYTLELNDRDGRLGATGYWATNLPDPAFDLDDDDGDRRWEEAEVIAGAVAPEPGRTYTSLVQFSRWHPKRLKGRCTWAWDRRRGEVDVLSQLSRHLAGEWQAERYTHAYDALPYERVGSEPPLPAKLPRARCREPEPGAGQAGYVVTFARPLGWRKTTGLVTAGSATWTAFEAVGARAGDARTWTCGGPFDELLRLRPCAELGIDPDGLSAAAGYFDDHAIDELRAHEDVAAVEPLRDTLTDLLFDIGGFDVDRPGLTVNDRYWELVLND